MRRRRPEDYIHENLEVEVPNGDINRNCGEFHKLALFDSDILWISSCLTVSLVDGSDKYCNLHSHFFAVCLM